MGDIVSVNEEKSAYEVKHEKLNVTLNIEKVTKHVCTLNLRKNMRKYIQEWEKLKKK